MAKSPEKLKADYLDMYKGVYVEVISTDRFDEDTNLSTTYLGQVDMARDTEVKAGESFPMTARGYTKGQLLDGTDCEILIDTDTSKSYMSKSYFPAMQELVHNAKIYIFNQKNSGWQWTICRCVICYTSNNHHKKSQV